MLAHYQAHPSVRRCVAVLRGGGVIAYPTEAVWGLGCDPQNNHAIAQILALKQRHADKGLILVASRMEQFEFILRHLSKQQRDTLQASWPGPFTWLVPHNGEVSHLVCGQHNSVALRVSDHPVVKALCENFAGPIVSTSANRQGLPAAKTRCRVRAAFGPDLCLAPGQVGQRNRASEIRDLISGKLIRA